MTKPIFKEGDVVKAVRQPRLVLEVVNPRHESGMVECKVISDDPRVGARSNRFFREDDIRAS